LPEGSGPLWVKKATSDILGHRLLLPLKPDIPARYECTLWIEHPAANRGLHDALHFAYTARNPEPGVSCAR